MHVLVVYITIHGPVTADATDDLEDIIFKLFPATFKSPFLVAVTMDLVHVYLKRAMYVYF
jgi:hypothetical protein